MSDAPPNGMPEWERAVRASFASVGFLRLIGATLDRVEMGEVEISLPMRADLAQQHGFGHGGMIATVLDAASGYAAMTTMPPGHEVLSVEFKVNFLNPAVAERFVAIGRVVKSGRTLVVTQGEVRGTSSGGDRKTIAVMQGTMVGRAAGGGS